MNKQLIATDYDGTLRIGDGISEYNIKAIKEWQKAGGYFGIVTGRDIGFIETIKEFDIVWDYLILYNGSLIIDKDGTTVFESVIPYDIFKALEDFFEKCENLTYYSKAKKDEKQLHYYATAHTTEQALETAKKVNDLYGSKVTAFVNGQHINIGLKGTGKAQGVSIIAKHYGLDESQIAVVGDDYNDLEMIKYHNGWAVERANNTVKQAAAHICASVGDLAYELLKNR